MRTKDEHRAQIKRIIEIESKASLANELSKAIGMDSVEIQDVLVELRNLIDDFLANMTEQEYIVEIKRR